MPRNFGPTPEGDVEKVLINAEELRAKCAELGAQITRDYADTQDTKPPLLVGVLSGAAVFMSDLVRCINIPVEMDFISVSSYGQGATSGDLRWLKDVTADLQNRRVIIVEDIVDTGKTLSIVSKEFVSKGASSVEICTLLDKKANRATDIKCRYIGFECPDEFVIGYGIDYAEHYRNLPYVGALKRCVYA